MKYIALYGGLLLSFIASASENTSITFRNKSDRKATIYYLRPNNKKNHATIQPNDTVVVQLKTPSQQSPQSIIINLNGAGQQTISLTKPRKNIDIRHAITITTGSKTLAALNYFSDSSSTKSNESCEETD